MPEFISANEKTAKIEEREKRKKKQRMLAGSFLPSLAVLCSLRASRRDSSFSRSTNVAIGSARAVYCNPRGAFGRKFLGKTSFTAIPRALSRNLTSFLRLFFFLYWIRR